MALAAVLVLYLHFFLHFWAHGMELMEAIE
jgi:hypothetical protein